MEIKALEDQDLKKFSIFCRKNLPNSFIFDKKFLKFWFKYKNKWSIDLVKLNKEIISINLKIKNKGLLNGKKCQIVWTSTAFTKLKNKKDANIGILLLNIHRENDIVASISPNEFSYKLNSTLGYEIKNISLNRFIYLHNLKFIEIITKNKKSLFTPKDIYKSHKQEKILSFWTDSIPRGYNKLWKEFSSKFRLCVNKDSHYLRKRYLKSPFQKYHFLKMYDKKKLIGFSVIRYQKQKNVKIARITEFVSTKKYEKKVWREIVYQNSLNKASISDFFVVGNDQNLNLNHAGFKMMKDKNKYFHIPNLMSPLNHRQWSKSFRIGGKKISKKNINNFKKVWFTKGDGDRDHPTRYDVNKISKMI